MESFPWVKQLVAGSPVIAPSLLAADFAKLGEEVHAVEKGGAQVLHVDVMDGHFVPNISVGVPVVRSLRRITQLPLDVHLMISEPERYIEPFRQAGADSLLVHIEVVPDPREIIEKIRALGAAPGLVINPGTPVEAILPYVPLADIVLVMSVQPGFGGQDFRPEVLEKVRAIKKSLRSDALLSIDGGINAETIPLAAAAGTNMFVAGTAVFDAGDYRERMQILRQSALNSGLEYMDEQPNYLSGDLTAASREQTTITTADKIIAAGGKTLTVENKSVTDNKTVISGEGSIDGNAMGPVVEAVQTAKIGGTSVDPVVASAEKVAETAAWRKKSNIPEGLWLRCPGCQATIFRKEAENRFNTCPECDYHWSISAQERIKQLLDEGTFEECDVEMIPGDPLGFSDRRSYVDRVKEDQQKTGLKDAAVTGIGRVRARKVAFGVTDSRFIMGSMGSVVGEKLTRINERAKDQNLPLIIVSGSGGGARMHEGIFSLMQMAKVSAALARFREEGGLFISVLTNPTMGGVAASFASLGDLIFAEPKALIGFAGPRTIKATIRMELPKGFQTSEFLLEHGYIDRIVPRWDLQSEIARAIDYCNK